MAPWRKAQYQDLKDHAHWGRQSDPLLMRACTMHLAQPASLSAERNSIFDCSECGQTWYRRFLGSLSNNLNLNSKFGERFLA